MCLCIRIENINDGLNWNAWYILFQRDHNTKNHDIGLSHKVTLKGMGALSPNFYWTCYPWNKNLDNAKKVQYSQIKLKNIDIKTRVSLKKVVKKYKKFVLF